MDAVIGSLFQGDERYTKHEDYSVRIELDTGTENPIKLNMFESWLELWCQQFCTGEWKVTREFGPKRDYQLVLSFSNPHEAVHFKLAADTMHVRPTKSSMMVH